LIAFGINDIDDTSIPCRAYKEPIPKTLSDEFGVTDDGSKRR
jgi:hypothetical protein